MTLQNVRALLWRGEDLGYGGGNTRELITSTQVAASARPLLVTLSLTNSQDISAYLGSSVVSGVRGQLRAIMNRSPRYHLTLTATLSGSVIKIPIAPLQTLFLPQNVIGPANVSANSVWPIPVPPTGVGTPTVPLATGQTAITFDMLLEN